MRAHPAYRCLIAIGLLVVCVVARPGAAQNAPAKTERPQQPRPAGPPLPPMPVTQLEEDPDARRQARPPSDVTPQPQPLGPAPIAPPAGVQGPIPGQQLPPLPVTQLEERQRLEELDGRTISLSLAEPLPIQDVLILLVRDTRFSIVVDPGVEGTFSGELRDVTVRQALDLILQPLGLDWSAQGNIIRVFRRRVHTRMFDVNYVASRRTGRRSFGVGGSTGDPSLATGTTGARPAAGPLDQDISGTTAGTLGSISTQVSTVDDTDLYQELAAGIQTLLSSEGRFNLDRKAALLQVSDFPERLDSVGVYLEAVQARVHRQVLIQAQVLEIDVTDPANRWWGMRFDDLNGRLKALWTQGRITVVSSPRVVAMNNEPAVMRIGTQDVYFVTTRQMDPVTGKLVQTTVTPQPITEGIVLSITPQISGDGIVNMNITHSTTERTGAARSRLGDVVPVMAVREADTVVRVQEGETVVITGLMQDELSVRTHRVPILGDLPLIGSLFRTTTRKARKTDTVILLTPTVLTAAQIAATSAREQERLQEAAQTPPRRD